MTDSSVWCPLPLVVESRQSGRKEGATPQLALGSVREAMRWFDDACVGGGKNGLLLAQAFLGKSTFPSVGSFLPELSPGRSRG